MLLVGLVILFFSALSTVNFIQTRQSHISMRTGHQLLYIPAVYARNLVLMCCIQVIDEVCGLSIWRWYVSTHHSIVSVSAHPDHWQKFLPCYSYRCCLSIESALFLQISFRTGVCKAISSDESALFLPVSSGTGVFISPLI